MDKCMDKLTNRYGGKGVISKVKPDYLMPKTYDGETIDIQINICGVVICAAYLETDKFSGLIAGNPLELLMEIGSSAATLSMDRTFNDHPLAGE